jgi:hypothetical protein
MNECPFFFTLPKVFLCVKKKKKKEEEEEEERRKKKEEEEEEEEKSRGALFCPCVFFLRSKQIDRAPPPRKTTSSSKPAPISSPASIPWICRGAFYLLICFPLIVNGNPFPPPLSRGFVLIRCIVWIDSVLILGLDLVWVCLHPA